MIPNYALDTKQITLLQGKFQGIIEYEGGKLNAHFEYNGINYFMTIDEILDFDIIGTNLQFISDNVKLEISATVFAHRNSMDIPKKQFSRYTECKVCTFTSYTWDTSTSNFTSYLHCSSDIIYDNFGTSLLNISVKEIPVTIRYSDNYIVIESDKCILFDLFCEIRYNILVALGFVSGKFIQNEVYTFQKGNKNSEQQPVFKYEKLRQGSSSIYHALTGNPFGYKHLIGKQMAEKLYSEKTLKYLDSQTMSKLTEFIHNNSQIQYALVLFNDTNSNGISLLIKNNCFYIVMEVLRKFFYNIFKPQLPIDYSQKGNIEKFKMVFECFVDISDDEISTIKREMILCMEILKNLKVRRWLKLCRNSLVSYIG